MTSSLKTILALAWALLFAAKSAAWAAGVSVMPLPMRLSPNQPSELLRVTNDGDSENSFQIRTFVWTQLPDGTIDLHPSLSIVAFPEVFTIGPNETRNIRVGVLQPSGAAEATYRLVVQQLPPPPLPGKVIQILPGIDLPVFIARDDVAGKPEIAGAAVAQGALSFALADAGTAHILLQRLIVTGRDEAGRRVFAAAAAPSYVLAGGHRDYAVQIGAGDCTRIRAIAITAHFADQIPPVTQEVIVPPDACWAPSRGSPALPMIPGSTSKFWPTAPASDKTRRRTLRRSGLPFRVWGGAGADMPYGTRRQRVVPGTGTCCPGPCRCRNPGPACGARARARPGG
ncbi:MAG TPA: fimbria/pilus periplasmic chaperone [Acidocella sp.]|uniref:fimbria/pilus periplasmic chaperone n=1 Tax=Acidocella sp. TaxID=50710 RepID=UPI002C2FBBD9|nr:fimbria/pilus periplasmic chaperone [Acidocella sp.]HVE23387.1 fimbria/pilus periplasmic chaperone [Acidocella sp.]